jgi:hypothetical protein
MADQTANPYLDPVTGLPKSGTSAAWLGTQQQVADSMAGKVAEISAQESPLNQMARVEGLKAANRRGLMNSSMAIGASQEAVLKNALPIASQDAAQAFQKNQAAKAFEYGMTAQEAQNAFTSGERLGGQVFQTGERVAGQEFQTGERLGAEAFTSAENIAARGWQTAENIAQRGFLGTQAQLDRDLEQTLQTQQIKATEVNLIRQIASTEGIEAANRQLQKTLQENDIQFRMREGNLDRAAAVQAQKNDIAFQTQQNALTRDLQERIAKMNLTGTQQAGAAQMINNTQAAYQSEYQAIQSNTKLSATARANALTAANNRYRAGLNLVEQTYGIRLGY